MLVDKIEKRSLRVALYTTSRLKVEGPMFVAKGIRLIDELNLEDRNFVGISQAAVTYLDAGETMQHEFVIVNKREIVCIIPLDAEAGHSLAIEDD